MALPPAPPSPPLHSDSATTNSPAPTSSSSSTAAASSVDLMKQPWVPLLISLSKELNDSANTQSTAARLLLHNEIDALAAVPRFPLVDQNLNFRPVVGILSHPGDGASGRLNDAANASYIAASYVKFVESAGARVIPLVYNEPWEVIYKNEDSVCPQRCSQCNMYKKLSLVNGVIFTGGRIKGGPYFEVVGMIFKEVLKKNDAGDHFPLLAICLGFELLAKIVSEDDTILERFNAKDQASTLQFVENLDINGTLFQRFPEALLKKLSTECLVMQNHIFGISPEKFRENKKLSSFFKILTTSADEDGEVYVSTVQAHRYPVTAVQWHPEKNAFESGLSAIPHSEDAVHVTQHVANFFVREARMSMSRPSAQKVLDNLIYNYCPSYCGKAGRGFDEVYIFS